MITKQLNITPFHPNSGLTDTSARALVVHETTGIAKVAVAIIMEYQQILFYLDTPQEVTSYTFDGVGVSRYNGRLVMVGMEQLDFTFNQLFTTISLDVDSPPEITEGHGLHLNQSNEIVRSPSNFMFESYGDDCDLDIQSAAATGNNPQMNFVRKTILPGDLKKTKPFGYDPVAECFFLGTTSKPQGLLVAKNPNSIPQIVSINTRSKYSFDLFPFATSRDTLLVVAEQRIDCIGRFLRRRPVVSTPYTAEGGVFHRVATSHPDRGHLLVATNEYACRIFSVADVSKPRFTFPLPKEEPLSMSANREVVAILTASGACTVWGQDTGVLLTTVQTEASQENASSCVISDLPILVINEGKKSLLYDMRVSFPKGIKFSSSLNHSQVK